MRPNHSTNKQSTITRFALGQTFITPGAEEALQIAGQTAIEFLRRHMSCDWGELSVNKLLQVFCDLLGTFPVRRMSRVRIDLQNGVAQRCHQRARPGARPDLEPGASVPRLCAQP